jgi:ABC-2 type transport system permease protein
VRTLLTQTGTLARRSVMNTLRQPASLVPAIVFPLMFMAVTTAGAGRAALIPGFPAKSYLDFYLAGALVNGTLLGGISAGTALALDIEQGFVRRLLLTPMQRPAVLIGHVSGAMLVGLIQGTVILGAGLIAGARVRAGIAGALLVVVLAMLVSLTFSSIGALIAARTGSSEATQSVFPLFFVVMIFSSYFMPRNFIGVHWFRFIATYNPVTYMIEAMRSLITHGWDVRALGLGLAAVIGLASFGFLGAAASLRTRLART